MQEEIARQDVPRQQIHHLGLAVGRRRAGRRHVLQVEHDDARRPEIQLRRRIQRRESADQIGDVALENLRRLLAGLGELQAVEHVAHLVGAHRADQVLEDRHRVALGPLGQAILAGIAQRVHHVAPVGLLVVQLDAVARDRPVDLGLDAAAIVLGAAAHLGAEPIGLVDHQRDQLRHALERRGLVGRQGRQRQKVLQEGASRAAADIRSRPAGRRC